MKKILVLSANPVDTSRLRLDEEVREIQESLKRSNRRDEFEIATSGALRVDDLRRGLLDHPPSIMHFSGHGESQGLILENDVGQKQLVGTEALAQLFSLFPSIECVLLNACYSEIQADAIHQHVNCVIGMSQAISDRAAINFAVGFYDALGAGRSYQDCFAMACNAIDLNGLPESAIPRIKIRQDSEQSIDFVNTDLPCPYKGLSPFRIEDAEFFYGRDVFVEELLAATKTRNFIPILGDSGSGKSSVVFAGLVPRLQKTDRWIVIEFRPEKEPFHSLAWALMPFYTNSVDSEQLAESRRLSDHLQNGTVLLADVFKRIQENYPQDRVLLIADQFEEIYTLCDDEQIRRNFLDVLLAGLKSTATWQVPPILVATMRIDFYSNVLSYPDFADAFRNSDIKIRSMNRDELKDVIEKPANQMGVNFESGLVDRILDELENQTGNLPLLEFALTELWDKRINHQLTHAAYQEIGAISKALASYADKEYKKLKEDDQKKAPKIFVQLVRPGEKTPDTKRLAIQNELGNVSWNLVSKLADAKLVVTSQNSEGQNTVELVHEALIDNWDTLKQWVKVERVFRGWQERLRMLKTQWVKTNKNSGSLLRGVILREAIKELKERGDELKDEQEFIKKSISHNKKDTFFFCSVIVLVLSTMLYMYFVEKRQSQAKEIEQANSFTQQAALLTSSQQYLDALVVGIKAGRIFQSQKTTNTLTMTVLNEAARNVREYNRLVNKSPQSNQGTASKIIITSNNNIVTLQAGKVTLWNITGEQIFTINSEARDFSVSSDGNFIALGNKDGKVEIWSGNGNFLRSFPAHDAAIRQIVFSPDNKTLISAIGDDSFPSNHVVKLWDINGLLIRVLYNSFDHASDLVFSPDGKKIAGIKHSLYSRHSDGTGEISREIILFDIENNLTKIIKVDLSNGDKCLAFSSSSESIYFIDINGKINSLGLKENTILKTNNISTSKRDFSRVFFTSNAERVVISSKNTIELLDISGNVLSILNTNTRYPGEITISPDNNVIAFFEDNKLGLWHVKNRLTHKMEQPYSPGSNALFSADGKSILTGNEIPLRWGEDGKSRVISKDFELANPNRLLTRYIALSPDDKIIATTENKMVSLLNEHHNFIKLRSNDGRIIHTIIDDNKSHHIVFSPDGKNIASIGGNSMNIWQVNGNLIYSCEGSEACKYNSILWRLSYSPDGKMIAISGEESIIMLKNTGQLIHTIKVRNNPESDVVFIPDNKTIAFASGEEIQFWSIAGEFLHSIKAHDKKIIDLAISPDGKMIASAGADEHIKLWDITGKILHSFKAHDDYIYNIAFSPDGKKLVSNSEDKTIKIWSTSLEYSMEAACDQIRFYLKNGQDIKEESDRRICDDVKRSN